MVVLIGLFFLEYPPIFLFGYWSWGPVTHKVLSGVLLIVNLVVAQYAGKRAFSLGHRASADATKPSPRSVVGAN